MMLSMLTAAPLACGPLIVVLADAARVDCG
jgi:hypothetical protein